jgi:hypothetical protein
MSAPVGMKDGERCNRVTAGNPGGLFDGKPCIGDMHYPESPPGCECYGDSGPCRACQLIDLECDVCGAVVEE